jgi:thymidylate synthase (FAD)
MKYSCLDHGYVEFIEAWGRGKHSSRLNDDYAYIENDFECGIIEAARQSTQGSFRGWDTDQKLLAFLYNSDPKHATPFEFAGMTIEVQAPIFVFREWHRHRTQSYNEMSARYAPLPDLYYYCSIDEVIIRARKARESQNKQEGSADSSYDEISMTHWVVRDRELSHILEHHYQQGLRIGVPKELARKKMPVDHYSRMRASANLRNWLAFLTLRKDPKAQWEIRQFANAVGDIVAERFPHVWDLFIHEELV